MKDKQITIQTKNGNHKMSREGFIRWLCLIEIVEKTEEKAKELKINLDNYDWVKPVDFKKYIRERFKSMEIDLEYEEKNNNPTLKHFNNTHHTQEYYSQTYQKQTF
jgi:hypothetical protein